MRNIIRYILVLFAVALMHVPARATGDATATDISGYLNGLRRFDISCRALDIGFDKRTCGTEHIAAFTGLIKSRNTDALDIVEVALKLSKGRASELEEIAASAPPQEFRQDYEQMVLAAQDGEAEALEKLGATNDPALIPYLIDILQIPGVIPAASLREKLAELEIIMEKKLLAAGGAGLDAAVLESAVKRENDYAESLKRAVIALEGTRRKFSPGLPFFYAYLVGLLPFLAGVIASVKYYGRLEPRAIAIAIVSYAFYVCMHGFFQFIAPHI